MWALLIIFILAIVITWLIVGFIMAMIKFLIFAAVFVALLMAATKMGLLGRKKGSDPTSETGNTGLRSKIRKDLMGK